MYRRKTVEVLLRAHQRREEQLLAIIKDQTDRIMYLAGKQYGPTPLELAPAGEPLEPDDDELIVDVSQLPDSLGIDAY